MNPHIHTQYSIIMKHFITNTDYVESLNEFMVGLVTLKTERKKNRKFRLEIDGFTLLSVLFDWPFNLGSFIP